MTQLHVSSVRLEPSPRKSNARAMILVEAPCSSLRTVHSYIRPMSRDVDYSCFCIWRRLAALGREPPLAETHEGAPFADTHVGCETVTGA